MPETQKETIKEVEAAEVREQPTKTETIEPIDKQEPGEMSLPLKVTNAHRFSFGKGARDRTVKQEVRPGELLHLGTRTPRTPISTQSTVEEEPEVKQGGKIRYKKRRSKRSKSKRSKSKRNRKSLRRKY